MKRKNSTDEWDRPRRGSDAAVEMRQALARLQLESERAVREMGAQLQQLFRRQREEMEQLLQRHLGPHQLRPAPKSPPKPPRRPRRKGGGSEAVSVEPNRPKLGEGGAAAALEFDE